MTTNSCLDILRRGQSTWNAWREKASGIRPSLFGADLRGADLRGYDFRHTNLRNAVLEGANISGSTFFASNLDGANIRRATAKGTVFTDADLSGAGLEGAVLIGSNFSNAALTNTLLDGADLCIANLSGAKLQSTSLREVKIWDTSFANVDLSKAMLDDIEFQGPCDVGVGTLEMTALGVGNDGEAARRIEWFLRGCGASDESIEYFRTRIGSPIQWYTAFISYAHTDKGFARRLYDQLQSRGIRCWLDEHDLKPGERILESVNQAIRVHDRVLLCCSEASLRSWWVKDEIRKAQEKEQKVGIEVIIPVLLDDYLLQKWEDGLAADLRSRLGANFGGWQKSSARFDAAIERLILALKAR